jgi:hypothetical protein
VGIDEKTAAQWTEEDLREVCEERRRETARLEFKSELSLDSDRQKFEAERDAQGMANSGGGHIIYGIAEGPVGDGGTAAESPTPLADGSLYERLNNVLDARGEPRLPFEIHQINAAAGGSYLVVEVFASQRPHRASDGRYYIRRNLLVRKMTEAEVAAAYHDRFVREAASLGIPATGPQPGPADEARNDQRELLSREFRLYRAETGSDRDPGWLSVLAIPTESEGTLIDPFQIEPTTLYELSNALNNRWRLEEAPLTHYRLQRTTHGFYGQLPDRDDTYPRYLVRFWRNGVAEFGDLLEPMFPETAQQTKIIPSAAIVEYTHDFLLLAHDLYRVLGYHGTVEAEARLENVRGYELALRHGIFAPELRPFEEDVVAPDPWRGGADELTEGAADVARSLAEHAFLEARAGRPYMFENGTYRGRR